MGIMKRSARDMSVRELARINDSIGTDESFERPIGCWKACHNNSYLESIWAGSNSNPIVVANNILSMHHSAKHHDTNSEDYFKSRASIGEEYTSIDGQHRRDAIREFLSDKRTFTGKAYASDGTFKHFKRQHFSKIPKKFRDAFEDSFVAWQEYTVMREQMSELWRKINSGAAPNAQQMRNAIQTPFASWTRELSSSYEELWSLVFDKKASIKMSQHELITRIYLQVNDSEDAHSKPLNSRPLLDSLYEKGQGAVEFEAVYSERDRETTEDVIQSMFTVFTSKVENSHVIPTVLALIEVTKNEMEIYSPSDFRTGVMKADARLEALSVNAYSAELKEAEIKNKDKPSKKGHYFEWSRVGWSAYRHLRQKALWEEINKDLMACGLRKRSIEEAVAAK